MAEENDAEKSFQPTPRRLEQAREKGQIARSRELSTAAIALGSAIALWWSGPAIFEHSIAAFRTGLSLDRETVLDPTRMSTALVAGSFDMLVALVPLLGLVLVATLVAPMLLSGWVYSTEALSPDFSRLSPLRGLKNMFSARSLVELAKAVAKCVLLGGIGWWVIASRWDELQQLAALPPSRAIANVGALLGLAFFALVGGLLVIALADVPWQLREFHQQLRMTRQEMVDEQREMEGDPQLKARIRSQQREVARRRMMEAVPGSSVIVTNPTHFAVALEYRDGTMRAPKIVAKGLNLVALRIRELGELNRVPVLEVPPLARALYRHAEIGDEVPPALYAVVAQVLAYVYRLERHRAVGRGEPPAPADFEVPAGLDPLGAAAGARA